MKNATQCRKRGWLDKRILIGVLVLAITAILIISKYLLSGDPVNQFKHCVETLQRNTTNELCKPIRYDIKKTDSLVSPLVGHIEYSEIDFRAKDKNAWGGWDYRLTLAYQDGKWVLTQVEARLLESWDTSINEWRNRSLAYYQTKLGLSDK